MSEMKNAIKLMLAAFSDCTGVPVKDLSVNTKMRTKWDTGAFTAVALPSWPGDPRPIPAWDEDFADGLDFDMKFEVQCMKSGDSSTHTAAVNLHLHNDYGGLWTTISVDCPQEVFDSIDIESIGQLGPGRVGRYPVEHIMYSESGCKDCYDMTLVEDLPRCRELICRLCRELAAQLWKHGYFQRPVEACPDLG